MEIKLLESLAKELKNIFKDFKLKSPYTKDYKDINVFIQDLPPPVQPNDDIKNDIDNELDSEIDPIVEYTPYAIIKTYETNTPPAVTDDISFIVIIVLCCFDNDVNYQGYRDLISMKNKIYSRFLENKFLESFEASPQSTWSMSQDNTFPYFFGGLQMTFYTANYKIEDFKT